MNHAERFNHAKRVIENGGEIERDTCSFLIEELEAAQQRIDELEALTEHLNNAAHNEHAALVKAEAELTRRDRAAGEPVKAVVKHYTGCKYPVIKINSLEVVIAGEREDADELAEFINSISPAAAQPAALPRELTEPVGEWCLDDREGVAWMAGANWMRERVKALGSQPEKAIKLPQSFCADINSDEEMRADFQTVFRAKDIIRLLEAAGVKWKEAE